MTCSLLIRDNLERCSYGHFHAYANDAKRKQSRKFISIGSYKRKSSQFFNIYDYEHSENHSLANILAQEYVLNFFKDGKEAACVLNKKLQALGKDDAHFEVVFLTFRKLVEESIVSPNAHLVTTVITVAGKRGYLNEAKFAFDWSRSAKVGTSARPTSYTYTAFIQAIGQNIQDDNWKYAFKLFDEMIDIGLVPNVFTYSVLIRAGVRGGESGALQVCPFFHFVFFTF